MKETGTHYPDQTEFTRQLVAMLKPEAAFYRVILIYSVAISLLTLAIPISVQMLIDTVANIGRISAVLTIAIMLFVLLLLSGLLYALRAWTMELFNRRLFSRLAGEIAMTGLLARSAYFEADERAALFNRFFDIMTLKKNLPYLLSYGFSAFFQALIGILVVSLYHFYFFIFSVGLILVLWLVWRLSGWKALVSAFRLSEAKHATARWLQGLATNSGFWKATSHMDHALARTDAAINHHLDEQEAHFRYSFGQLLSFLFIYALASALLLGIGGWLVIQGQLTLGQLVAAELIMSAIFYGLPQAAGYLDYMYDVGAAIEELSRFGHVETERMTEGSTVSWPAAPDLRMHKLKYRTATREAQFSLQIPAGSRVRAQASTAEIEAVFSALLQRVRLPDSGILTLGEQPLEDCDLRDLRQAIVVLDRQTLLPVSIREYLALADSATGGGRLQEVLELLELGDALAQLPQGLDTPLAHGGHPLPFELTLRLKLAFVLLGPSRLAILGSIFDCVQGALLSRFLQAYTAQNHRLVIYFTDRVDLCNLTHQLQLDAGHQQLNTL